MPIFEIGYRLIVTDLNVLPFEIRSVSLSDRDVWDYLAKQVILQIIENKASNKPIRV